MKQVPLIAFCVVVAVLVLSRVLPHPPNFTPLIAVAFFAGVFLKDSRAALLVPLVAMLIADALLGFHSGMLFVYGALALAAVLGGWLGRNRSLGKDVVGLVSGSAVFFAVSNFGVWLLDGMYPANAPGLAAAYVAGIPFFHNTLVSTLLYGAVIVVVERLALRAATGQRQLDA